MPVKKKGNKKNLPPSRQQNSTIPKIKAVNPSPTHKELKGRQVTALTTSGKRKRPK